MEFTGTGTVPLASMLPAETGVDDRAVGAESVLRSAPPLAGIVIVSEDRREKIKGSILCRRRCMLVVRAHEF